jgi:hypothetical protein
VVVRSLVAAGIPLTLGIVMFLSLHDAATLGEPWVRSGTVTSSEQEVPEAAARSGGLPMRAERRGIISGPTSTAAMATPEPIPELTASEATLAPVEELTTLRATLPLAIAAPGQTTQAPEALPSVASPAPAEKQAASPTISPMISPQATQSLPNQYPSATETAALVARGECFPKHRRHGIGAPVLRTRGRWRGRGRGATVGGDFRPRFPQPDWCSRCCGRPHSGLVLVSPRS